jgi:hypothetical protein
MDGPFEELAALDKLIHEPAGLVVLYRFNNLLQGFVGLVVGIAALGAITVRQAARVELAEALRYG